jgi:hypothetical protein
MKRARIVLLLLITLFHTSCSKPSRTAIHSSAQGEYIQRHHEESLTLNESMEDQKRPPYPWEELTKCNFPKINKEFFRCRGKDTNPVYLIQKEN